jgi:hypothetical protein
MLDHDYENDPDLDIPEPSLSYITVTKPIMHSVTIIRKA